MRSMLISAVLIGAGWSGFALADSSASSSASGGGGAAATTTSSSGNNCRIIHRPASARSDGPLSSTVTAGPNGVTGATTNANGVQVQAGGSSVSSSSTGGGQTVTTDADGHCTVTIFDRDQ